MLFLLRVETETGDDGLWLGDAIRFVLDAKRAGGRSRRTMDDYRKKLELFQCWVAARHGAVRGSEEVDAPYLYIGADEVEAYMVHLKEERGMVDSSGKNHLAVLRSFFQTVCRRLDLLDPTTRLDESRFHQKAPKRSYLTKREADILLSAIEKQEINDTNNSEESLPIRESRRRRLAPALAARDHAAFSVMIYAGLRIEETTALVLGHLSFARGEEQVRVVRGKDNKERVVPMSPCSFTAAKSMIVSIFSGRTPSLSARSTYVTGLPEDLDEYVDFSMISQAEGLKFAPEHFRRRKPHCSGTLFWQLNDC